MEKVSLICVIIAKAWCERMIVFLVLAQPDCPGYTTPFSGLFSRTTWVSRYPQGKTSLDLNEARDDREVWDAVASAEPYANKLHLAPHHSVFYRPDALPDTQPTVSEHWRQSPVCIVTKQFVVDIRVFR